MPRVQPVTKFAAWGLFRAAGLARLHNVDYASARCSNDFSAVGVVGEYSGKFYVLDVRRKRVEYPELKRLVLAVTDRWRPSHFYVEDTANATALIQQFRDEAHLPIVPVKVTASKESRAEGVSGIVESGRVVLPTDAPWLAEFEDEVCSFPSGDHDDMLDAFVMALAQAARKPLCFSFSFGPGAEDDLTFGDEEQTREIKARWAQLDAEEAARDEGIVVPADFAGGVGNALRGLLG